MKEENMRTTVVTWKACRVVVAATAFLAGGIGFPFLCAQPTNAAIDGELASARISVNGRSYEVPPNQEGCSDRVSNVERRATTGERLAGHEEQAVGQNQSGAGAR
jgi:hypothetical protein